jgi:hypothetical protein
MFKKILGYTKHLTFDPQTLETDPEQENRARIVCTMPLVHQPDPRSKLYNRSAHWSAVSSVPHVTVFPGNRLYYPLTVSVVNNQKRREATRLQVFLD